MIRTALLAAVVILASCAANAQTDAKWAASILEARQKAVDDLRAGKSAVPYYFALPNVDHRDVDDGALKPRENFRNTEGERVDQTIGGAPPMRR